ncbi:ABC transporter permease [Streptomyces sp. ICN988]|uniref:ABC transporter permease n=1 Tax=Streptomyces salinarius TaxID=2762598 RepID=A0ABW8B6C3_9ACTN|nr:MULTISPECIES: ABC transporter permease [unclassified Streptomyces]MCV2458482.1 ABC transporter permease [Streptomyces sp. ICN988]NDZ71450.1 ABC transporter permease [Streptomyces sp. SID10362]
MLGYIRLEILRLVRNGGYLMMSLVMPVGLYVTLAGGGPDQESLVRAMVGAAAFGALGVVITNGTGIAEDRALGWLRQLRLTPLSPVQVVVARGAVATCLGILPIVVIGLIGGIYRGVDLSPGTWLEIFLLLWVGIAPLAMLGIGIGYLFKAQLAQIVGTVSYLTLTLLGGLMMPTDTLPQWLQPLSRQTPVYRYAQLSWDAAAGSVPSGTGLGVLALWTALLAAFAAFAYRRGGRRA